MKGVSVRTLWGERILDEVFLPPGPSAKFNVGSFELVRAEDHGAVVHLKPKMRASVWKEGAWAEVSGVDEVPLASIGCASVEVGAIRYEISERRAPPRVESRLVPEDADFTALNVALIVFFLGACAIITANLHASEITDMKFDGDLPSSAAMLKKVQFRIEQPKPLALASSKAVPKGKQPVRRLNLQARSSTTSGPAGRSPAKALVTDVFGGASIKSVLGGSGAAELNAALGGVRASGVAELGLPFGGKDGGGAGPGSPAQIGGITTRGRDTGYGNRIGTGLPGRTSKPVIDLEVEPPVVCGGGQCGLDREVVRRVIHAHRSQARYCYELELQRRPELAGKIAVSFVIGVEGAVTATSVASDTMGSVEVARCLSSRVRTWVFPKPNGGGAVSVTYPFVFKPSGG